MGLKECEYFFVIMVVGGCLEEVIDHITINTAYVHTMIVLQSVESIDSSLWDHLIFTLTDGDSRLTLSSLIVFKHIFNDLGNINQ